MPCVNIIGVDISYVKIEEDNRPGKLPVVNVSGANVPNANIECHRISPLAATVLIYLQPHRNSHIIRNNMISRTSNTTAGISVPDVNILGVSIADVSKQGTTTADSSIPVVNISCTNVPNANISVADTLEQMPTSITQARGNMGQLQ